TWICAGKLRLDEIQYLSLVAKFKCRNKWTREADKPAQLGWVINRSQLGEFTTPKRQDIAGGLRNI
ncbi:hypothetical protein QBC45DRAFT_312979, partial [Copromyces sp. CBS 386.78]